MAEPTDRRELEFQADQILKDDRKLSSEGSHANIDLLSKHDARRRSARQADRSIRNQASLTEMSVAPEFRMTPEEHLLETERRREFEGILEDIFAEFQSDATAFEILIQVLTYGEHYRDNKRLAELLDVRVDDIRAAKQRIRYYVTNTPASPF